jgi:hypothetical protein
MTAEERAGKFFDDWNAGVFHHDDVPSVLAAAIREAEAAAAARQREADAAVCRAKADEFRELLVDEAVLAASECAAEILAGGPKGGR